jgi:biotin/methionine sulfoxide reductase
MTENILRSPHCSHWGAYTILVKEGQVVGIEAASDDPNPSPLIHSVKQWADPSLRVLKPMVREGWLKDRKDNDRSRRGEESFVAVNWEEALELVAGEINRVRTDFGNTSIFAGSYGWTSAGRFQHAATLLKRMLNLVGGFTNHVDTYSVAAGPVILRHTLGSDEACYGQGSTLDTVVDHTETLIVFGSITPRTAQNEAGGVAQHLVEEYLRGLVRRGVRVVLVSPVRDDVPAWVNAEWWPIRPNTDTALMIGLAGEILRAGKQDNAFLERCCSGSERFLGYLRGDLDGKFKDANWAAEITGLDASLIRSLAPRLVDTRTMLTVSWSLQRAQYGEQPYWAALALAAMVGQIGLPGGGVGYGYGSTGGVGAPIGTGRSPGMTQLRNPTGSFIPVSRIAEMLLNPGKPFTYQGQTRQYPDARLVYWAGGNPFHHHQDINRLVEAWAKPETIIVQDPVWTATALRADIVLPACTSIERNDLAGNKRTNYIMAMRKAIEPLGESRSDFEIFRSISTILGVGEAFDEGRDEMEWIRHLYNLSREHASTELNFEMVDFDTFWDVGRAEIPVKGDYTYLADYRDNPEAHPLKTESGRIVLGSETLAKLGHTDCIDHPSWFEPREWLGKDGVSDELHLISNQPIGRLHSQIPKGDASLTEKAQGIEKARINPADAKSRGINTGDIVRLWNARGASLASLCLDEAVREGVIVLPTGAWFTPSGGVDIAGNPNVLTLDIPTSAFGQGCAAYTCLVRVEKHEGAVPDAMDFYERKLRVLGA